MIASAIIICPSTSWAVTNVHSGYCDDIESTAAALKCITEHKDAAEDGLSKVFEDTKVSLGEVQTDSFLSTHKHWIEYRDAQCGWESEDIAPALKRLQELSCLTQLTEERTLRLKKKLERKEMPKEAAEFSAFPTWLNALYKKHPNVIWDVKSQEEYDVNCDNLSDYVIKGVSFSKSGDEKETYKLERYVAVSNGNNSGKPNIHTVNTNELCASEYKISRIESEENSDEECHQGLRLVFSDDSCEQISIFDQSNMVSESTNKDNNK